MIADIPRTDAPDVIAKVAYYLWQWYSRDDRRTKENWRLAERICSGERPGHLFRDHRFDPFLYTKIGPTP